jgi:polyhydroxybutyrate depolymerase
LYNLSRFFMQKLLFKTFSIFLLAFSLQTQAQTTVTKTMISGGMSREYRVYIPAVYLASSGPVPVVFNFHGYTSSNIQQEFYGDFRPIADTANFILVHPQGTVIGGSTGWNNFGALGTSPDDIGFVSDMIDSLAANYNINKNRIYATGLSNGGFMSYDLACLLSNKITAIASVAGSQVPIHASSCNALHPTPIMQIHGDIDAVVSYTGVGGIISCLHVDTLIKNWVTYNNCNTTPSLTSLPDINTTDNSTVQHFVYTGGTNGSTVELYKIIGGGHTWPGSPFPVPSNGNTNLDFSASKEIWRFFSQYALNNLATTLENPQKQNDQIAIYPNPATNQMTCSLNNMTEATIYFYTVYGSMIGQYKLTNTMNTIDVTNFTKGIYTMKIITSKNISFQHILIQ